MSDATGVARRQNSMALRRRRWRESGLAGMANGEHRAMVMVSHEGVDRYEAVDVLCGDGSMSW